ncbi:MAG TPA: signal recognition particle protein [Vicinamibacteria bacterium]
MFDALSDKLEGVFRTLRGQGSLTVSDVDAALREIRLALLEADVHFKVAKQFLDRVREKATGQDVLKSLTPAQAVIRIVRDEMVELLGGEEPPRLQTSSRLPSVILMAGLQGSGKTTTSAKLGAFLAKAGNHPLLVSTDVYRPAAREQLRIYATSAGLTVHHPADLDRPAAILRSALDEARAVGHEFVIVDTAGRLHIDDELMTELQQLKAIAQPSEVLYVADAMTGQDAVRSAEEFHKKIGITGIVLSKLDGDARGGAALSAAAITGMPVKFAGVGERVDEFELFQPARMAGRILGMGDVLGLIEKAEQHVDREKAEEMVRKLRRSEFTLDDYKEQLGQVRKMGSLDQVLAMIPGIGSKARDVDTEAGEKELGRHVAIIDSMTALERREPSVINGSRRKRIAKGSGTTVEDVNRLLKQYVQARKMMKQFGGGGKILKKLAGRMPPQFR